MYLYQRFDFSGLSLDERLKKVREYYKEHPNEQTGKVTHEPKSIHVNKNTKLTRGDLMLALDITRLDFQKELAKFKSVVENPTKKQCNVMKAQLINELYGESINWSCCYKDIENLKFLPIIISKGSRKMNRSLKKQLKKMVGKCYLI